MVDHFLEKKKGRLPCGFSCTCMAGGQAHGEGLQLRDLETGDQRLGWWKDGRMLVLMIVELLCLCE